MGLVKIAPSMLRRLARGRFAAFKVRRAAGEVRERWQLLKDRGDQTIGDILGVEPDLGFILEQLGPGKLPPSSARALAALTWGVLPTP